MLKTTHYIILIETWLGRNIGKKLMIFIVLKWNNNFNAYRGNVKLKLKFLNKIWFSQKKSHRMYPFKDSTLQLKKLKHQHFK